MGDPFEFSRRASRLRGLGELLAASHREFVPIREAFVQKRGEPVIPGSLGKLVADRQHHALDLYLLLHAVAASPPHQIAMSRPRWVEAVRGPTQSPRAARVALSRSLEILQECRLMAQLSKSRDPILQLLNENGDGTPYLHPARTEERYFTLPYAYWYQGFDLALTLPAKATLLIARSLRPVAFTLPLANAGAWYGLSSDTLRRGMQELTRVGAATYVPTLVASAAAPERTTVRRRYTLSGALARSPRHDAGASRA